MKHIARSSAAVRCVGNGLPSDSLWACGLREVTKSHRLMLVQTKMPNVLGLSRLLRHDSRRHRQEAKVLQTDSDSGRVKPPRSFHETRRFAMIGGLFATLHRYSCRRGAASWTQIAVQRARCLRQQPPHTAVAPHTTVVHHDQVGVYLFLVAGKKAQV